MPGIPLLNIGTALGGLAGGWSQARSQGLQQAIQQFALQQQQGLTNQQTLAGLALQLGLLNQPGGGQTPLGIPGQSGAAPQQPSTVNIANVTPPASGSGGGAPPGYAPPLGNSPYGPPDNSIDSASEVQLNADAGQDQFGATNQAIAASGATPPSSGGDDSSAPKGSPQNPYNIYQQQSPTPTATPTPAQSPASSGDSGQGSGGGGIGMQFGNGPPIDMSTMFQRLDYQKLAQGIAQLAPPGTSQADIYGAVVDLSKLAEGDKTQQQQAAYMLKLLGIQGNLVAIDKRGGYQTAIAQGKEQASRDIAAGHDATRVQTTEMNNATKTAIANQSAQLKQQAMQANNAVKWTQIAQRGQALAQQLNIAGQREAAQAISQQLSALRAQISTIKPGPDGNYSEDDVKKLQAINDRIASIGAKVGAQQGAGP